MSNCSFNVYFKYTACPLLVVTSFASLIQNLLFCGIVWFDKALHRRSMILIVNLSVSGIIYSLTVPFFEFVHVYFYPVWPFGKLGTNLQNTAWIFSLILTFMTVTCITTERYLVTVRTGFYRAYVTSSSLGWIVFIIWIYSLAWTIIISLNFSPAFEYRYVWNVPRTPYYIFLGIHLILPLAIIAVLYQRILNYTRKSRRDVSLIGNQTISTEVRLTKTVGLVIGCLYGIWIPVVLIEAVYSFDFCDCVIKQIDTVGVILTAIDGFLVPILYFLSHS
ncbi:rhodopsin, GQ-coupled-like [Clytia hemisphaerica]|uniref:G-protein coupled receptors family 1 profile domain-containing protein n=1 Tax=Clytia hemisphaerica TaxID=252671 RepID=A0A7M6DRV3_9CNID